MNAVTFCRFCATILALLWLSNAYAADTVLWYNGDYAGGSGTVNENSSNVGVANIYEDFNVTAAGGWAVQRIWSNDFISYSGVTSAAWSIRSGISTGNGGTIIASGTTSATQTATGRTAWWGVPEYTIQITGLNVFLATGTYWLSVSPVVGNDPLSNGQYRSYVAQTSGANAIGSPAGNNGNSFNNNPAAGYNFAHDTFNEDYSMGIAGTVVPEPSTLAFSAVGGMLLLASRKKSR